LESNFIQETFSEDDLEQTIIEEIEENKIIYGLKTAKISEEKITACVKKLEYSNQIGQLNLIRIEEV